MCVLRAPSATYVSVYFGPVQASNSVFVSNWKYICSQFMFIINISTKVTWTYLFMLIVPHNQWKNQKCTGLFTRMEDR